MTQKLRECAFCGSEAEFSRARAKIECQGLWCNIVMCGVQGDKELIRAWNTRQSAVTLEEAKEALEWANENVVACRNSLKGNVSKISEEYIGGHLKILLIVRKALEAVT